MARDTMDTLIGLVRVLINDPLSANSQFMDDEIEAQLDLARAWKVERLQPLPIVGSLNGTRWQSVNKYWESDVELSNGAGEVIVPDQLDSNAGYFVFAESQDEVTASGFTYDVFAASAELLTVWAGRIEQDITKFSADGSSFEFASVMQSKLKQAESYRAQSKKYGGIRTAKMVRDDCAY